MLRLHTWRSTILYYKLHYHIASHTDSDVAASYVVANPAFQYI